MKQTDEELRLIIHELRSIACGWRDDFCDRLPNIDRGIIGQTVDGIVHSILNALDQNDISLSSNDKNLKHDEFQYHELYFYDEGKWGEQECAE